MINKKVQNLEFILNLNVKNGNSYMYMYNTSLHFSVRGFPKEFIEKINQKQILFLLFGLMGLTPLSTIFHLYRGGQLYCWRKPEDSETCRKSLTNFITKCCIPRPDRDSNSQHQW
jgi:hypothetical protein